MFTDHFWQVTTLRGPRALIDDGWDGYLGDPSSFRYWKKSRPVILPKSILDLHSAGEISHAARKYRHLRNLSLELRASPRKDTDDTASLREEGDDRDR